MTCIVGALQPGIIKANYPGLVIFGQWNCKGEENKIHNLKCYFNDIHED